MGLVVFLVVFFSETACDCKWRLIIVFIMIYTPKCCGKSLVLLLVGCDFQQNAVPLLH